MNKKAEAFKKFIDEKQITCFTIDKTPNDKLNTVVFRSHIDINGQTLATGIIFDSSIYSLIRVQVVNKVVEDKAKDRLLWEINSMNKKYKVFKYYFTDDGGLYLDSCILCEDGKVSGELVYTVLNVIIKHLENEYKNIMKDIWQ